MKKPIFAFVFLLLTIPCYAEIIIVDNEWPYDFNNIQAAINYAANGDYIFVLPGTYAGPGNRDVNFLGKAVTVRSIDPTDPYYVARTIIDYNGVNIYDPHRGFLFQSGEDANSVLAGFTIISGSNCSGSAISCKNSSPTIINCTLRVSYADAIYCYKSSPVISNCTISDTAHGSGIYCESQSCPKITGCVISGNTTTDNGGGIYCRDYDSSPTITNCTITGNSTGNSGGGIYCSGGSPVITNCVITGNSSFSGGGGIYFGFDGKSNPTVTGCVITGNSAEYDGGGIYCSADSAKVANCTISDNLAGRNGGGIVISSRIPVTNCIIWGNADSSGQGQSAQVYSTLLNVWFSCIQVDNPGDIQYTSNIDDDPCFVAPGFWDVNGLWHDGDYHLRLTSPCIDAGDPYYDYNVGDVDIDGQPRLMARGVDMGADEVEASVIVVTKPKGGEVWVAGSTHEINWDSYGLTGMVDIYYSDNNGVNWVKINNAPDTGSFIWHLLGAVDSNRCLVSVEPNVPPPNLISTPGGPFTIHHSPPGPPVASKWKSLGGNFDRAGLSQNSGPELGCVKWQFHTNGPVSLSPSISADGRIHLSCEDGNVYALDANGLLLWSYDTNSPLLSSPTIGLDGSVFVGAENGTLFAIDVNGNLRWTHSTGGPIYSSPAVSADGSIYACSQDGTLYALGRDGSELWTFDTNSYGTAFTGAIFTSPAIGSDGTVYIAGLYDSNLYALDSNDGHVKWSRSFLGSCDPNNRKPRPFASPIIAADGAVYISPLFDSNLYAVNSSDGNIIWSASLADPCYPYKYVWSEPALGPDGTIYVSFNDPYLRAVNPNGSVKWVTRLGVMGGFTLTIGSDGLIYAASDDAYLCVVDTDGKEISRFRGSNWLSFPVITADNTMIVCDENNTVWALGGAGCGEQASALHRPQDLTADQAVNFDDFVLIANDWLKLNCFTSNELPPCEQYPENGIYFTGDVDRDLYVDFADLAELADKWLSQE